MADGYDPKKSQVREDSLADFLRAPLTGDLRQVPGIGPAAEEKLAAKGIYNSFQLIGQFLLLKDSDDDGLIEVRDHCDAFWKFLQESGISSYRSGIVMAIAEKVNVMMPGMYDASQFD